MKYTASKYGLVQSRFKDISWRKTICILYYYVTVVMEENRCRYCGNASILTCVTELSKLFLYALDVYCMNMASDMECG